MKDSKIIPPRAAQRLLMSFLRHDLAEDVAGDLEEKFYKTLQHTSAWRARANYWYQVIQYLRPFALRKSKSHHANHYAMFENYFKIGWRNLSKQKMYSFIKIGGFALGIAACLLIALFIRDEISYDRYYENGDRIYRVYEKWNYRGDHGQGGWMQAPFARAIKEDYPEIEKSGRYNSSELFGAGSNQIRRDDQAENTFEEGFVYMSAELLDILEMHMVYGTREHALSEPMSIVLTRSRAEKYFPGQDPVGKLMVVNNDVAKPYKVGGVIEDFPPNSHIQYKFLITLSEKNFWTDESNDWGATNYPTYIVLKPGADKDALEKKMDKVVQKYLLPMWLKNGRADAKELESAIHYGLQPVHDIHLNTLDVQDGLSHGDKRFTWLFGGVAIFILVIACINFINLSTAKSANRAKEVGLRKTVGSYRSNIISQFLVESMLFSVLSFVLGLTLAWCLLPYFNALASKSLSLPWTDWWFVPAMLLASMIIGMVAGVYPSFYLSSFKPVQVLKGNLSRGSKNAGMRSVLVVFQFTTSIVLIISTVIIYRQVSFILSTKIGFDKEQVLLLQGTGTLGDKAKVFKDQLQQLSPVKNVTVSDYLPIMGTKRNGNGFWIEGKQNEDNAVGGQFWVVDHDYIKTLGMKIVDGRDFSRDMASDSLGVIINQKMAHELGLKDPIGKQIRNWRAMTVIGVVEDFNFESMRSEIEPLCLVLGNSPGIISVKFSPENIAGTLSSIENVWKKMMPNQQIRYTFLDESFARMYEDVQRMGSIFTSFAILAIVVACLGLFALSAFMVEQRSKEISIRLALGASLNSIFNLLTFNFVKLVLIAIVIAVPIAWYMMDKWLQDFKFKTDITWDVFAVAGMAALLIALLTISYQSLRAGMMRPVEGLRSE